MTVITIPIHPIPSAVRTTCPYYGIGCDMLATPQADGSVDIQGGPIHPANTGCFCAKSSALGEIVSLEGRLLCPAIHQRSHDLDTPITPLQRVTWDIALDTITQGFRRIVDEHDPDAVTLYVSGQLLTEDYHVANKLMKGLINTASIDTNSRLHMSSAMMSHKRAFDEGFAPACCDSLEATDLIMLVGSNATWCYPVLLQHIVRTKKIQPEMKVAVIDPHHTTMCELVDLHLPIRPGIDVRLFNGPLSFLSRRGAVDRNFVTLHTSNLDTALKTASTGSDDIETIAETCKLRLDGLLTFYSWLADMERTITALSMDMNQPTAGADRINNIIDYHLLTSRIGCVGMELFSITDQPNAVGGYEIDGLANMLTAHIEPSDPSHRDLM